MKIMKNGESRDRSRRNTKSRKTQIARRKGNLQRLRNKSMRLKPTIIETGQNTGESLGDLSRLAGVLVKNSEKSKMIMFITTTRDK